MRAELRITIDRSPEDVWAFLTDVANVPRWQSGVKSAEVRNGRIEESRTLLGRDLRTTLEIEEERAPRVFTLRAVSSPVPFRVRHELAPAGDGTELTVVAEAETTMLPGFAAGLMARRAEKQFRKDFARLKEILEER